MKGAEDSPFFYRCHLKASRKKQDGKSESGVPERPGLFSRSDEVDPGGTVSRLDSVDYLEPDVSGSFKGE
ncbi:hypothetical protein NY406_10375 [Chlorobaculum sp. MV4-Y]|jgi:hypothetical protein|uniref:hypothetical protein n=1 Tax=Chlorobaculum sp. MV4-Y TaxID=2976335 RepID=UPI0021AF993B|nr:hypothetical protein [Chlorobaculum sp. MV4-Y]UWX57583.1 hypothetical protein NY406_10375 [Chlorobaculum sp. MV4-Y]